MNRDKETRTDYTFVESTPAEGVKDLRGDEGVVDNRGEELVSRFREVEEVWDGDCIQDGICREGPETRQLAGWREAR